MPSKRFIIDFVDKLVERICYSQILKMEIISPEYSLRIMFMTASSWKYSEQFVMY